MNHTFSRFALALSVILISQFAYAQTVTDTLEVSNGNSCTTLTYGMSLGSRDSRTNGQVSDLQAYLQAGGYLSGDPTGYFGALTKKAVQKFQSANGITPNGLVGPYTRAMIKEVSCNMDKPGSGNVLSEIVAEAKWNTAVNNSGTISVSLSNIPASQEISSYKFSVACSGVTLPRNGGDLCGTSETIRNLNVGSFNFDFPYTHKGVSSKRGVEARLTALNSSGKIIGSIQKSLYSPTSVTETSSPVPLLSVISVPDLKLEYSPEGGEAVLVASYTINIVAGDKAISSFALSGGSPVGIVLKKANGEATNVSVTLSTDGPATVPAGNSAVYRVNGRVDPKKLFAGTYYMEMIPVLYTVGEANYPTAVQVKPLGSTATNYRTIFGEVSPYITKIGCDATPNINCTIQGVRFSATGNSVTLNGVTKTLPSFSNGTYINFVAADFGLPSNANGSYVVQVTTNNGASNYYSLQMGQTTQTESAPVVEFISKPTLSLAYDWQGKEARLTGRAIVKITAGSQPMNVAQTPLGGLMQFSNAAGSNVYTNGTKREAVTYEGAIMTTIPANTSVNFSITNSVPASELFAGSYTFKPSDFNYLENGSYKVLLADKYKNAASSNPVTVIGETSPYISSVAMENGVIVVKGARLDLPGNSVLIDGIKRDMGATVTSSSISIPTQTNGIGSGWHSVEVLNATTGNSNRIMVETTTPPLPTKYTYTFPSTADKVSKMAVGSIPLDLSYDITKDGKVTSADALAYLGTDSIPNALTNTDKAYIALRMSVGTAPVDMRFDITGDGKVTSADSIAFSRLDSATTPATTTTSPVSLASPALSVVSPVSQSIVGGSTFGIATYSLATGVPGTSATVRELHFSVTGGDAIESVTIKGVTVAVVAGSATVTGISIPITSTPTNVPVMVKFSGFQNTTSGGVLSTSLSGVRLTLNKVEASDSNGRVSTNTTESQSNSFNLVASKPTVGVGSQGTALVLGAENKIGEFTVTADSNGKIALSQVQLTVSSVGVNNFSIASPRVAVEPTVTESSASVSGNQVLVRFGPGYEILPGQTKTFSVYATINGSSQTGISGYVASYLSREGFVWKDVIGGNTQFNGSVIYNFPTNSFKTGVSTVGPASSAIVVKPEVVVSADPTTVTMGGQSRLTWSSKNATKCTWTEGDNQFKLYENTVSGTSRYTSSISATQRYTLTCENASGSTSASVTINVTSSTSASQVLGASAVCVNLPYNMHRGNETPNVKKLQEFLVAQGLLEEVTGFYGDKTVAAVKEYQMNKGLPVTGMVYDFTRMAISSETCQ